MKIIVKKSEQDKLWAWTDACAKEIAAFGYIKPTEEGNLYVDEVFLVPQQVSGTEVDFMTEGLPYAVAKAAVDERLEDLRFLWHSHVNMQTFYSSTDEDCISKLRKASTMPWLATAIYNKKGDTNGRLDLFKTGICEELNHGLHHITGIKLDIGSEDELAANEERLTEIEQFVKIKKYEKPKGKAGKGQSPPRPRNNTGGQSAGTDLVPIEDDKDTKPVSQMSPAELDRETKIAKEMWAKSRRESWQGYDDNEGWTWFFDESTGVFKGSCITMEGGS